MKSAIVALACVVISACVFALASPALAGVQLVKVQNLTGADFPPGQLKLPLTVHERSGVERKGAVVSSGVPFPPGFLADVSKLAVVDKDGKPVLSQASVMLTWHKPAYDDSVQWALVSFAADVPANGTATYYLTDSAKGGTGGLPASGSAGAGDGPAHVGMKLTRTDRDITIDTGGATAATFVIPLTGPALLSSATISGKNVLGPAGLRGTITPGEWADRGVKPDVLQTTSHNAAGVTVEESGPARVVVAIKGSFTPGDKDEKFYDFTARLYFAAGSPEVRVVYTLSNGRLDPTLTNGARHAYVWPILGASLAADLALNGKATAATLLEGKLQTAPAVTAHQNTLDDCTVILDEKWPLVSPVRMGVDEKQLHGNRHLGVLDIADDAVGLTIARRYFREEWPGSMRVSAKELAIGLLPGFDEDITHLNLGQRKSWDIRLTLRGGKPADAAALQSAFAVQDALLLFRPDPNWMVQMAGETGAWSDGLAMTKAPAGKMGARRSENVQGKSLAGGWERFGVIDDWNAGGWHFNEASEFNDWVIHGNGAQFDNSEIPTLWAADHCPMHFDNPNMAVFFGLLNQGSTDHARLKVITFPGYPDPNWKGSRDPKDKEWRANPHHAPTGWPDTGHMGMWIWVDYYLLTGDARCREAICHLGQYARAYLWHWTHDDPKDGTGPGYPAGEYRKRNPDAEPDFKLDRRYVGWPLYCLSQFYQFTGDPAMLAEAKIINGAFRNTARACPIGMLCRDCAGKNGEPGAEYSGNIIKREKDGTFKITDGTCASQARECIRSASLFSSNFYSGIVIYAIREYYLASRDPDALDLLVGQADRFCQYTMIRDPESQKPLGWSYMFGDYWGPSTLEESMVTGKDGQRKGTPYMNSANELTSDAVARLYPLTGRADVLETIKAAEKPNPINERVWALHMALMHPKVDQTPPAAVKDLAAEVLGGGKVKLSWTAPAAPGGQVAFYQVKWTTAAKLVERVTGWPDRTDPLPTTPEEWLARANAFNAKQRSFWAANNVPNLAALPKPSPAGSKESMTVEGLPPGAAVNLAVKSWSAAQNISDMSNVVSIMVR